MAANDDELSRLHNRLAEIFLKRIEGEDCPASLLKEAREFLKDNGITSDRVPGKPLDNLVKKLPFDNVTPLPVKHGQAE